MKSIADQLSGYASYHRDRRNIATHFIGIPMIVVALAALLSRPAWPLGASGVAASPAWVLFIASTVYYLVLDVGLGLAMTVFSAACVAFGQWAAAQTTPTWLALGIGLFVVGWVFQFVGHAYEGRKPAFTDDVIGLLIGPLFVLAELVFSLGARAELLRQIEAQAGPTRINKGPRDKPHRTHS
jgi:uncharacterized membrane protein YGL010W